ncbi:MAG: class I SAM-dependent methyltransferase [Bacteroidota bacterium]
MSKKSFLKEFIRENKSVGSVTPSSRFLVSKILKSINFKEIKVIVELGPGTGVFTREIIKKLPENVIFLVLEINEIFYSHLKKEFNQPNVILINGSAAQLLKHLKDNKLEYADTIVSSLPLSNFDKDFRNSIILEAYASLKSNGKFIQFQYSMQSKKTLNYLFRDVKIGFTAFNFPPAFVYVCSK